MALFGVVFALGAGSAAAQNVAIKSVTVEAANAKDEIGEGTETNVVVTLEKALQDSKVEGDDASVEVTITLAGVNGGSDKGQADQSEDLRLDNDLITGTSATATRIFMEGDAVVKVPLTSLPDPDAVNETFTLTASLAQVRNRGSGDDELTADTAATDVQTFTIDDDETQGYDLMVVDEKNASESGPISVNLYASPMIPSENEGVRIFMSYEGNEGDMLSDNPGMGHLLDNDEGIVATPVPLTVTPKDPDGNRMDDTVTLVASMFDAATAKLTEVARREITVADEDMLPAGDAVTVMALDAKEDGEEAMSVAEGGMVYLMVTVDRGKSDDPTDTSEAYEVELSPADPSQALDIRLSTSSVDIPTGDGERSAEMMVTLEALMDEDIGEEMLTLNLMLTGDSKTNGEGYSMSTFSIMIDDATMPMVSVKDDAYDAIKMALGDPPMLTTGMSGQIMTADLFDHDPMAVTVSFGTSVEGAAVSASASGEMVMVMAEMAGEAKVTVTATATSMGDSLIVNQTVSNVAQLTFPVMVEDEPLAFTVMGPEDMNLVEGGMSAMVTVTANRGVDADTEVMLMRDGASVAGMDDVMVMPEMATIMAGDMMAEFEVMAVEDEMMEEMEGLTLFAVVDGTQTDLTVMFYLWDAAVPALPLIAQLLLAAFLALGGYRRYLRR